MLAFVVFLSVYCYCVLVESAFVLHELATESTINLSVLECDGLLDCLAFSGRENPFGT